MATEERDREGIVDGIRVDVVRMHETWMELLFPRQRGTQHSVLGKWKPTTTADRVKYRVWSAIGAVVVGVLYPMMLVGLATRFYARRFDSAATRIGVVGVVLALVVLWGALSILVRLQLSAAAFLAVVAASVVAILAAVIAVVTAAAGGRKTTVLVSYPFGVTALFLPPVTAGLFSPTLGGAVLDRSVPLAEYLLNLLPVGIEDYFRTQYELEGLMLIPFWFGISVPVGWVLGILVTLADIARPSSEDVKEKKGEGKKGDTSADD